MIELDLNQPAAAPRPTWFDATRDQLVRNWRGLLAVAAVTTAATAPVVAAGLLVEWQRAGITGYALLMVCQALLTAWSLTASLAVLRSADNGERMSIGHALASNKGALLRLAGWLLVVQLVAGFSTMLVFVRPDLWLTYLTSDWASVTPLLAWYLSFATALLPMAIVLERRGIVRAWRLAHKAWETPIRIVAVLALSYVSDRIVDAVAFGRAGIVLGMVIAIPVSVVSVAALYVTYLYQIGEVGDRGRGSSQA